jgi:ubiquinone/menaquinone biosynthesis C-methylase UbiE
MNDGSAVATLWREYAASRPVAAAELRQLLGAQTGRDGWRGVRVLDLGCGDGAIAQSFAEAGARVAALDLDPWRVENSRRRADAAPGAHFAVLAADGHRLPFARGAFDLVLLSDLIEHVKDPARVLDEVVRVLRPGGAAYLSIPNRLSIVNLISDPHYNVPAVGLLPRRAGAWCVTRLFRVSRQYTVERYFTWRQAQRLFAAAGLRPHYVSGWYEAKLRAGVVPKAPGRRWIGRLTRVPGVRGALIRVAGSGLFRRAVLPAWQFVAVKP